jgi:excisionase family DNA binding protein
MKANGILRRPPTALRSKTMENDYLLTKDQLAERLGLKRRGVECLIAAKKIPVLRISGRCVRFSWPRVCAALRKFEVEEVGAK